MGNRPDMLLNRQKIPDEKLLMGSIIDKYPVILNDGRTVVFISDKSRESEIRLKYELLRDNKFPTRCPRHRL